jgi:hypothetical protein
VGDDVEGWRGLVSKPYVEDCRGLVSKPVKDFGDLSDAVAVGVEDVDFGVGGDAGKQGLIVGYRGVNDD